MPNAQPSSQLSPSNHAPVIKSYGGALVWHDAKLVSVCFSLRPYRDGQSAHSRDRQTDDGMRDRDQPVAIDDDRAAGTQ